MHPAIRRQRDVRAVAIDFVDVKFVVVLLVEIKVPGRLIGGILRIIGNDLAFHHVFLKCFGVVDVLLGLQTV